MKNLNTRPKRPFCIMKWIRYFKPRLHPPSSLVASNSEEGADDMKDATATATNASEHVDTTKVGISVTTAEEDSFCDAIATPRANAEEHKDKERPSPFSCLGKRSIETILPLPSPE